MQPSRPEKAGRAVHPMYEVFATMTLGLVAGVFFIWRVNSANRRKQERLHQELRDIASAERDKQVQEALRNGHFDRWNQDK